MHAHTEPHAYTRNSMVQLGPKPNTPKSLGQPNAPHTLLRTRGVLANLRRASTKHELNDSCCGHTTWMETPKDRTAKTSPTFSPSHNTYDAKAVPAQETYPQ